MLTTTDNHRGRAIGRVSTDQARVIMQNTGIDTRGLRLGLDSSYVRHALKRHGKAETRRRHRPITSPDIGNAAKHFAASTYARASDRPHLRFVGRAKNGEETVHMIWERRKRSVILVSMWVTF